MTAWHAAPPGNRCWRSGVVDDRAHRQHEREARGNLVHWQTSQRYCFLRHEAAGQLWQFDVSAPFINATILTYLQIDVNLFIDYRPVVSSFHQDRATSVDALTDKWPAVWRQWWTVTWGRHPRRVDEPICSASLPSTLTERRRCTAALSRRMTTTFNRFEYLNCPNKAVLIGLYLLIILLRLK